MGHQVIRSSGHQVIRSSGHHIIRSSGHQIIRASHHQVIRSSHHKVVRSSNHQGITPSGHQAIRSSGHQPIRSQCHQVIRAKDHFARVLIGQHQRSPPEHAFRYPHQHDTLAFVSFWRISVRAWSFRNTPPTNFGESCGTVGAGTPVVGHQNHHQR